MASGPQHLAAIVAEYTTQLTYDALAMVVVGLCCVRLTHWPTRVGDQQGLRELCGIPLVDNEQGCSELSIKMELWI